MRWKANDGWRWRFAILPMFVGITREWWWLRPYFARSAGEYTEVRSVAEHRAALAAQKTEG